MNRVTQVLYPKDIGTILMSADIFPGANVVEAGFGSGALTLALLRSVGQTGKVTTYDLMGSRSQQSLSQIAPFMPNNHSLIFKEGDIYEGISEKEIDRMVLDLPEPWNAVDIASSALTLGGILLSFLPTILQVHKLVEALNHSGQFQLVETIEVMHRSWHVTERSVRPEHRMVAHTGFITTARKCHPKPTPANQ
jgi:tRNA (adenine57-N1/adenine58-N1)-methyltransferase